MYFGQLRLKVDAHVKYTFMLLPFLRLHDGNIGRFVLVAVLKRAGEQRGFNQIIHGASFFPADAVNIILQIPPHVQYGGKVFWGMWEGYFTLLMS